MTDHHPRYRILIIFFGLLWMQSAGSAFAQAPGATAFVHAKLVPMTSDTVLADRTVIVEGRHIAAIGPSGQIRIAPNTQMIDCRGAYLMPGLADMHMHLRPDWTSAAWPVSPLKLYLASGVTTVRCFGPGGPSGRYALAWRQDIDAGRLEGPRILTCGPALRGHFHRNPEEIVIKQKYQGFDFIKIYSYVTRQEFHTILATAKQLGIYTAGHIPFPVGLDGVLKDGNFGTIETGRRADLILVTENPLEDVAHIRGIGGVMAAGHWYDAATLQEMLQ